MKKDELVHLIAEAIQKSTITTVNKLTDEEIQDCAWDVVGKIASKLVIERVIIVDGSIDTCPDYSIRTIEEFRGDSNSHSHEDFRPINPDESIKEYYEEFRDWATEDEFRIDRDGFDKPDWFCVETFNLLED